MTRREATWLRQQWVEKGNAPCGHETVHLERTDAGYLTGQYLCGTCGDEISREKDFSA